MVRPGFDPNIMARRHKAVIFSLFWL